MKDKTGARAGKVRLARGRRLKTEADGDGHVLVSRAGSVRLNASAAAILELCDGTRTREAIVERIVRSRDERLVADVRDFLDSAQRRGWIVER